MTKSMMPINLKIIILGDSGVGKSSLILKFVDDEFKLKNSTVGLDFRTKKLQIDGNEVNLEIWDTAGQERFHETGSIFASYYRDVHGAILVYDVASKSSFENLRTWLRGLEEKSTNDHVVKMILGNKIDRINLTENRIISNEEVIKFRNDNQVILHAEVSAKTSTKENIGNFFEQLARQIIKTPGLLQPVDSDSLKEQIRLLDKPIQCSCNNNNVHLVSFNKP